MDRAGRVMQILRRYFYISRYTGNPPIRAGRRKFSPGGQQGLYAEKSPKNVIPKMSLINNNVINK
jgi:hypothetical protein